MRFNWGKKDRSEQHPPSQLLMSLARFFELSPNQVAAWFDASTNTLTLPFACQSQQETLSETLKQAEVGPLPTIQQQVMLSGAPQRRLRNIKNLVAVASGKGGVGKSASTVNLALALQAEGASVGILDADIYGPSIPTMLGNEGQSPQTQDDKTMQPMESLGLKANSIGYLVPPDDATVWRGPMASRALQQLLDETDWGELDYLLIDMPPGTGDIQLTLAQQIPVSGAVVVTTPQNLALADATKAIDMFRKVDVDVLGVLENMSYHQCKNCGYQEYLFDQGGGQQISQHFQVPLLGQIPLDTDIRTCADSGQSLLAKPSELTAAYQSAARQLARRLYLSSLSQPQAIDISVQSD
ncbi:Iron-sulfur cluster carrier protein [Saliniradius amylolyticus]|uniref:Iron-sulfur cluster carrier protein n=1 Tax=Saliniradius amylolyticus TaxID=2183582 RepID=A0A2S2E1M7_9ALTE|nr:iron-sulfur cluster carrier protein ApbC [Saliniradius amylolyticus]AWL11543.1 Iron-sulfur cluster carrier protein [Saliniradius amylolyticus]